MSSNLNEAVIVSITAATKTVAQQNFGIAMIVGANVQNNTRVVSVSSLAGALPYLNGGVNSPEYVKLQGLFAQINAPAFAKLGTMSNTGVTVITDNAGTFTAGSITTLL